MNLDAEFNLWNLEFYSNWQEKCLCLENAKIRDSYFIWGKRWITRLDCPVSATGLLMRENEKRLSQLTWRIWQVIEKQKYDEVQIRRGWDSNPRGQSPLEKQSNALTTRPPRHTDREVLTRSTSYNYYIIVLAKFQPLGQSITSTSLKIILLPSKTVSYSVNEKYSKLVYPEWSPPRDSTAPISCTWAHEMGCKIN